MSETTKFKPEHYELLSAPEQERELPEHAGETFAELPHEKAERLETIRSEVETAEKQTEQAHLPPIESDEPEQPAYVSQDMKRAGQYRALKHVRSQLSVPNRALSRLVHQPAIRTVSEVSAKTVSRPSGLLGGGFFAFLGSVAYLFMASHIGFRYNYTVFLLFFVGGFIVGLVLELAVRLTRVRAH